MVKIKREEQDHSCCLSSFQVWADKAPKQEAASSPFPAPSQVSPFTAPAYESMNLAKSSCSWHACINKTLFSINQIKPLSASKTSRLSKITLLKIFFCHTHVNGLNHSIPAALVRYLTDRASPGYKVTIPSDGPLRTSTVREGSWQWIYGPCFELTTGRRCDLSYDFKARS